MREVEQTRAGTNALCILRRQRNNAVQRCRQGGKFNVAAERTSGRWNSRAVHMI